MTLRFALASDPGLVREHNEDTALALPELGLFVVADGMGGHAAGDKASALVADTVSRYFRQMSPLLLQLDSDDEVELNRVLKAAVEKSAEVVAFESQRHPSRKGMGTTLTMAYLLWPTAFIVHIGDSRAYLFRNGELEQLTTDHTVAQQLVEGGAMEPEKALRTRWASVLWNVIGGTSGKLLPVVSKAALEAGDVMLLCTDGLTKHMSDRDLAKIVALDLSSEETCRRLVETANAGGGRDNITIIVAKFV